MPLDFLACGLCGGGSCVHNVACRCIFVWHTIMAFSVAMNITNIYAHNFLAQVVYRSLVVQGLVDVHVRTGNAGRPFTPLYLAIGRYRCMRLVHKPARNVYSTWTEHHYSAECMLQRKPPVPQHGTRCSVIVICDGSIAIESDKVHLSETCQNGQTRDRHAQSSTRHAARQGQALDELSKYCTSFASLCPAAMASLSLCIFLSPQMVETGRRTSLAGENNGDCFATWHSQSLRSRPANLCTKKGFKY